ncbi:MAG: response regulator [Bacteroidia bacterium]|nr:response regulator [Bacteroidia bacterium]MCZ2356541.1 response regulator [Bacteroidia bacterium]
MKKIILLLDDFENTLFVTGITLEQRGFSVLKSTTAIEALKYLNSNIQIDLVITDYNMPVMNGIEFMEEVKKIPTRVHTPIFILSTEKREDIRERARRKGVTAWIQKPFVTDKLVELSKRALSIV